MLVLRGSRVDAGWRGKEVLRLKVKRRKCVKVKKRYGK